MVDSTSLFGNHRQQQRQEFKKIRHKSELINRWLLTLEEKTNKKEPSHHQSQSGSFLRAFRRSFTGHSQSFIMATGDGNREIREVVFDARRVFDALDVDDNDSNGELLSFKE